MRVYGALSLKSSSIMRCNVGIIDYGCGNLRSIENALQYLKAPHGVISSPSEIASFDALILPGVGSFKRAMDRLSRSGMADEIKNVVLNGGVNILGICLGMQLLAESGTEDGECVGLGLMPGRIEKISSDKATLKVPHVGFNLVNPFDGVLFKNFTKPANFYFVHSYALYETSNVAKVGFCEYGKQFIAAYENQNVFGTQFHPEKSQTNGLILLNNFLNLKACLKKD